MTKKVETITDVRKRELKAMEKRLNELKEFRYGKDGEEYDSYRDYKMLPDIARKAVNNEMRELEINLIKMQSSEESIKKDLRDAISNVLKYYGVEDKMPEIEENFNYYRENKTLESMLTDLSRKISDTIDWETRRKNYY